MADYDCYFTEATIGIDGRAEQITARHVRTESVYGLIAAVLSFLVAGLLSGTSF